MASISEINQGILDKFTSVDGASIINIIGWVVVILIVAGGGYWYWNKKKNDKLFNKRITACEQIGGEWVPTIRDTAKTVKLGKGGFEILYLKKDKTWKIAYGGKTGKLDYLFFIMPDGYWYNGTMKANLYWIDQNGGYIPVVTTNPLMRGQYTSLEKQIDSLHGEKAKFWDKYGSWVLSIGFILIAGVLMWLMFKEYHQGLGELAAYHTRLGEILDKLANLASNIKSSVTGTSSNLVPA